MDINELITIVKKKLLNQINIENLKIEDKSLAKASVFLESNEILAN